MVAMANGRVGPMEEHLAKKICYAMHSLWQIEDRQSPKRFLNLEFGYNK
jgi:hypothetical protein